jgi:2'-5' RNA ligase
MGRVRLGVALLVPAPLDAEIDGMRRALGDGTLGRMPAHLTLVPPVNVREDRLGEALAVLRRAAAATRPLTVTLGPPASFLPDSPTIYLRVDGDVQALRDRVFVEPLARPVTWPFVAHVTLADEAPPERIDAALSALADYQVEVAFDRVHLLREGPGRVWEPIADAVFAPPAVIGRGGLPVEITVSERLDPEAWPSPLAAAARSPASPRAGAARPSPTWPSSRWPASTGIWAWLGTWWPRSAPKRRSAGATTSHWRPMSCTLSDGERPLVDFSADHTSPTPPHRRRDRGPVTADRLDRGVRTGGSPSHDEHDRPRRHHHDHRAGTHHHSHPHHGAGNQDPPGAGVQDRRPGEARRPDEHHLAGGQRRRPDHHGASRQPQPRPGGGVRA